MRAGAGPLGFVNNGCRLGVRGWAFFLVWAVERVRLRLELTLAAHGDPVFCLREVYSATCSRETNDVMAVAAPQFTTDLERANTKLSTPRWATLNEDLVRQAAVSGWMKYLNGDTLFNRWPVPVTPVAVLPRETEIRQTLGRGDGLGGSGH